MKKIILITTLIGGITLLNSSCKKNHICTCTTDYGFVGSVTWDTLIQDQTTKNADVTCTQLEFDLSTFGQTFKQTCTLD